jgi:hypothetical protein
LNLPALLSEIAALLRYLASPVTAAFLVGLFDKDHDAFVVITESLWPGENGPPVWIVGALMLTSGLLVYFLHRSTLHRWVQAFLCAFYGGEIRRVDLDYSRWIRRSLPATHPARGVQAALDNLNAAADFFYCSALCMVAAIPLLHVFFPMSFSFGSKLTAVLYWEIAALFLGQAIQIHARAARYDLYAHEKFGGAVQQAIAAGQRRI